MIPTPLRARTRPTSAGSDVGALVASAARLRWRSPELALLMADQAAIAAANAGIEPVRLRAEVLAVFACNQLGRGAAAGGRAVRALRAAERAGEDTTERLIRVELAACAADASAPSVGLAVLLPVFHRATAPTARAAAMVTAADCLARLGGGPDVAELLTTADELYDLSRSVEPDAVLLRRGVVHARLAGYHRRRGDHAGAEAAARAGLALVDELSDGELDTGQVSGSLTTELVLALLDSGRVAEAVLAAQPVLRRPARPAGAPAACWLRLALVSRVHLPAGRHALARRLLAEAVADAERNQLDAALAECRQVQSQLYETCAELGEAMQSLRAGYVADRRWRDTAAELRTLLAAEFGQAPAAAELRASLAEVLASHRGPDGAVLLSRADLARSGRPIRAGRSRHSAPTPLPVAHALPAPPSVVDAEPSLVAAPSADAEPSLVAAPSAAAEPSPVAEPPAVAVSLTSAPAVGGPVPSPAVTTPATPVGPDGARPEPPTADADPVGRAGGSTQPPQPTPAPAAGDAPSAPSQRNGAHRAPAAEPPPEPAPSPVASRPAEPASPRPPATADRDAQHRRQNGTPAERSTNGAEPGAASVGMATNGGDRGSGRHRSDVAMADLLAEALLAYENGRRSSRAAVIDGTADDRPRHERPQPAAAVSQPAAAGPRPTVRWTDLPRDLVWREPGSDRRR